VESEGGRLSVLDGSFLRIETEVAWVRWRLQGALMGLSEPRRVDAVGFDVDEHIIALTDPDDQGDPERFEILRCRAGAVQQIIGLIVDLVGQARHQGAVLRLLRRPGRPSGGASAARSAPS
jgi:hypothetical protein